MLTISVFTFIKNHWRDCLIGTLLALVIVLINRPAADPVEVTSEKIVYKDRIVDHIVTVTKTVAVNKLQTITKPDGTKIVTETHETAKENIKDQSHQEVIARIDEKKTTAITDPYRYSATLALKYNDPKAVIVDIGARLGGLPVSAVVGFDFTTHAARAGLRYDW